MRAPVLVILTWSLLDAQPSGDGIPVLTVCEALQDIHRYSGQNVIIVGRSVGTFEGSWISADCGFRVRNGPREFNDEREFETSISATYAVGKDDPPPQLPLKFRWNDRLLREKLDAVKKITKKEPRDEWAALFGRLETEIKVYTEGKLRRYNTGFGHMGAAPAQLVWPQNGYRKLR